MESSLRCGLQLTIDGVFSFFSESLSGLRQNRQAAFRRLVSALSGNVILRRHRQLNNYLHRTATLTLVASFSAAEELDAVAVILSVIDLPTDANKQISLALNPYTFACTERGGFDCAPWTREILIGQHGLSLEDLLLRSSDSFLSSGKRVFEDSESLRDQQDEVAGNRLSVTALSDFQIRSGATVILSRNETLRALQLLAGRCSGPLSQCYEIFHSIHNLSS